MTVEKVSVNCFISFDFQHVLTFVDVKHAVFLHCGQQTSLGSFTPHLSHSYQRLRLLSSIRGLKQLQFRDFQLWEMRIISYLCCFFQVLHPQAKLLSFKLPHPSPYPTLFYRTGSLMWYVCAKCLCDIRLANSQMQTAVQSRYLALISTAFSQLHTLETASVLSPHLSKLPHTHTHKVTPKKHTKPSTGSTCFCISVYRDLA